MAYMPKDKRISVRVGESDTQVRAMAGVLTTDAVPVGVSDVYRTLLAEALSRRIRDCYRDHRGPIKAGSCGHCGGRL